MACTSRATLRRGPGNDRRTTRAMPDAGRRRLIRCSFRSGASARLPPRVRGAARLLVRSRGPAPAASSACSPTAIRGAARPPHLRAARLGAARRQRSSAARPADDRPPRDARGARRDDRRLASARRGRCDASTTAATTLHCFQAELPTGELDDRPRRARRRRLVSTRTDCRPTSVDTRTRDPARGRRDLDRSCGPPVYSHSIVPGGLLVMSSTTRPTGRISLIIRDAICSSRS